MNQNNYVLGLDSSTQSLSAVIIDQKTRKLLWSHSISYKDDPRLEKNGVDPATMILPSRRPGEADQPPLLFLASLDLLFLDLKEQFSEIECIKVINVSAQQHGHVYLNSFAEEALQKLNSSALHDVGLEVVLQEIFTIPRAPIWKTSDTKDQSEDLRVSVGGSAKMISLTGSDSPLRFTGAVIRRIGETEPEVYEKSLKIHLLSSFIPAVLTANLEMPTDWGNGSGTSLMDYKARAWSKSLLQAASQGLPGGLEALESKLTKLQDPLSIGGSIASYFQKRFGFSSDCQIMIGSGDNPQSKVLIPDDLLSLGTSFVMMVGGKQAFTDPRGWGNAMYDALGRPFLFGCRTNGALVWDRARKLEGWGQKDFLSSENALKKFTPGKVLTLNQWDTESFPPSPVIKGDSVASYGTGAEYCAAVDSALGLTWWGAKPWTQNKSEVLYVTGGPTSSSEIIRRVAAFWNRPVAVIGSAGAALGAAMSCLVLLEGKAAIAEISTHILPPSQPINPIESDVKALHEPGGYLDRLKELFEEKTGVTLS